MKCTYACRTKQEARRDFVMGLITFLRGLICPINLSYISFEHSLFTKNIKTSCKGMSSIYSNCICQKVLVKE